MFTRRGKYVVRKLPANVPVGSATTLLDAADVAMADARNGPGKYVIEQPVIEVDVSKAYGVLAGDIAVVLGQPQNVDLTGVTQTTAFVECTAVAGAEGYQWYLNGVPNQQTAAASVVFSGLSAGTSYSVLVAAFAAGVAGPVSDAVSFQTEAVVAPEWTAIPAQALTVGVGATLDLGAYATDATSYAVLSGALPAGLSLAGSVVSGVPTAVGTAAVVFRATGLGGTADSGAVSFEALNADVTAPDAPTNFAAAGYSLTQVRLSWTNPADDAVVAGERANGFLGVDVYRDGAKVDRVLATAADPESYLATWGAVAAWKARSVDAGPSFNKSGFTAEVSAGPLVASANPPKNVVATRTGSLTATVTWKAGDGPAPTSYRLYMATALAGPYALKVASAVSPQAVSSGFTGAQTPYFYVTAIVGGVETGPSAIVSATLGTLTSISETTFAEPGVLTNGSTVQGPSTVGWRLLSGPRYENGAYTLDVNGNRIYDAFDAASGDVPCALVTTRVRETGTRSVRTQLTFHDGAAAFPTTNTDAFYPGAGFYHKAANLADAEAHRNEISNADAAVNIGTEYWTGASFRFPASGDSLGDPELGAVSFWGSYRYPFQLHGPTGGGNPVLYLATSHGWSNQLVVTHPAGAPIVRFARGSKTYILAANSANDLLVEWDAPTSGATPTGYRVYRSRRPSGPFELVATTGTTAAAMRYTETGLGTNVSDWTTAYVYVRAVLPGGALGPASNVCPEPAEWVGIGKKAYDSSSGSLVTISGSQQNYAIAPITDYAGGWLDVVFHYLPSITNAGYLEAWFNDVKVLSLFDISLGELRPGFTSYWKAGVYHGSLTNAAAGKNYVPPDWPKRNVWYMGPVRHYSRSGGLTHAQWKAVGGSSTADAGYTAVAPRGARP